MDRSFSPALIIHSLMLTHWEEWCYMSETQCTITRWNELKIVCNWNLSRVCTTTKTAMAIGAACRSHEDVLDAVVGFVCFLCICQCLRYQQSKFERGTVYSLLVCVAIKPKGLPKRFIQMHISSLQLFVVDAFISFAKLLLLFFAQLPTTNHSKCAQM